MTYSTLGEAIRSQASNLNAVLNENGIYAIKGHYHLTSNGWLYSKNNESCIIPCNPGNILKVETKGNLTIIGFLKSLSGMESGGSIDYSDTYTSYQMIRDLNAIKIYYIPEDTKYIWIYISENGSDRSPKLVKINDIDVMQPDKRLIAKSNNSDILCTRRFISGVWRYDYPAFDASYTTSVSTELPIKSENDFYIHFSGNYTWYIKKLGVSSNVLTNGIIYRHDQLVPASIRINSGDIFTLTIGTNNVSNALNSFYIDEEPLVTSEKSYWSSLYINTSSGIILDDTAKKTLIIKVNSGDIIKGYNDGSMYYSFIGNDTVTFGETAQIINSVLNQSNVKSMFNLTVPVGCKYVMLYAYQSDLVWVTLNNEYDCINSVNLIEANVAPLADGDLFHVEESTGIISKSIKPFHDREHGFDFTKRIVAVNHDDLAEEDWSNVRAIYNKYGFKVNFSILIKPFTSLQECENKSKAVHEMMEEGHQFGLHGFFDTSFWWINKLWDIRPNRSQTFAPSLSMLRNSYNTHTFTHVFNAESTFSNIGYLNPDNTFTVGNISGSDFSLMTKRYAICYQYDTVTGYDLTGHEKTYKYITWLEHWYNALIDDSMGYSPLIGQDTDSFFYQNYEVPEGTEQTTSAYDAYYPDATHLLSGKIVFFDDTENENYNNPEYQKVGRFKNGLFKGHASCCNYEVQDVMIKIAKAFCRHYYGFDNLTTYDRHGIKYVDLDYVANDGISIYADSSFVCVAGEFGRVFDTKLGIFETQQDILLRNGITCSTHVNPVNPTYIDGIVGIYYGMWQNKYPNFWSCYGFGNVVEYLDLIGSGTTWQNESYTMNQVYSYFEGETDWIKYAYEKAGKQIQNKSGNTLYMHSYLKNAIDAILQTKGTNIIPVLSLDTITLNASDNAAVELLCQYCVKNGYTIVPLETARNLANSLQIDFKNNYYPNPSFNRSLLLEFGGNSDSAYAYIPDGYEVWSANELSKQAKISVLTDGNTKVLSVENDDQYFNITTKLYGLIPGNYRFSMKGKRNNEEAGASVDLYLIKNNDSNQFRPLYAATNVLNPIYTKYFNSENYEEGTYDFTIPELTLSDYDITVYKDALTKGYGNNISCIMIVIKFPNGCDTMLKEPKIVKI